MIGGCAAHQDDFLPGEGVACRSRSGCVHLPITADKPTPKDRRAVGFVEGPQTCTGQKFSAIPPGRLASDANSLKCSMDATSSTGSGVS
jgi:hypothetical protein